MESGSKNETASRCTTVEATGAHTFEIVGYSLKKGIGAGNSVRSSTFAVGGCDWALRFFPDGIAGDSSSDHGSIHLELVSKDAQVRARYEVRLVKRPSGSLGSGWSVTRPIEFSSSRDGSRFVPLKMKSQRELEASGYIHGDCLTIKCVLTVIKESKLSETCRVDAEIEVPPPDATAHLAKLLDDKDAADVTFSVGGETFTAHKLVLAMRSPVFKAELYGPMRETRTRCVTVEDMQPEVFRAEPDRLTLSKPTLEGSQHLLPSKLDRAVTLFACSLFSCVRSVDGPTRTRPSSADMQDSLPDMDDLEGDEHREMIRHLLVAADRYAMDRLKLMCQNILGKSLDVETVATTLALADQHNCDKLKDVCVEFMTALDDLDAVMATKGYANLKRSCPSILVEVLEKTSKLRRF
ncbi:hypothetical protein ACP70R_003304 [Stipagrostis hirtigluma subsp. patula]